jgi:EAL domain-containing protein (putative c-di-GMP-specific phosphodiesterase class I)
LAATTRLLIRTVMQLGSSLGMITTAEGVETEEQFDILCAEGCMKLQGFLFSKPVPGVEIPLLLAQLRPDIRAA